MPNDPTCTECSDSPVQPQTTKPNQGVERFAQELWTKSGSKTSDTTSFSQNPQGFAPENFNCQTDPHRLEFNTIDIYKGLNQATPDLHQSASRNDEIAGGPPGVPPPEPDRETDKGNSASRQTDLDLVGFHWGTTQRQLIDQGKILTPAEEQKLREVAGGPPPVPPPEPDKTAHQKQGSRKHNPLVADNPAPSNPPSPDKTARRP